LFCKFVFSRRCSNCPQNKIIYNFLIISSNKMNKSFSHRQDFSYDQKNFKIFTIWDFAIFSNVAWTILSYEWHNLCSRAPIEIKIIFSKRQWNFLSSKKVCKKHAKSWDQRNLHESSRAPLRDPLGVKLFMFVFLNLRLKVPIDCNIIMLKL